MTAAAVIEAAAWIDLDAVTKRRRIVYSRCALSLIAVFAIAAVVAAAAAVRRIDIGMYGFSAASHHRICREPANTRNTEFSICTCIFAAAAVMDIAVWIHPGSITNRRRIVNRGCALPLITIFTGAAVIPAAAAIR